MFLVYWNQDYFKKCLFPIIRWVMPKVPALRLEPWYYVCSIILWTSTKFVQIMPLAAKNGPATNVTFFICCDSTSCWFCQHNPC